MLHFAVLVGMFLCGATSAAGLIDYSSDVCYTHAAYFSASTTVLTSASSNPAVTTVLYQTSSTSAQFIVQCMHIYETPPYNADGTISTNPYWGTCSTNPTASPKIEVCYSDEDVFGPQGGRSSATLTYTFDTSSAVASVCYDVTSTYLASSSNYMSFGVFDGPKRFWRVQYRSVNKGALCYPFWVHYVAISHQGSAERNGEPVVWIIVVCVAAFVVLLIIGCVAAVCFSDGIRRILGLRLKKGDARSVSVDSNVYAGQTLEDLPSHYQHVDRSPSTTFSPSRHVPRANLSGIAGDTDSRTAASHQLDKHVDLVDAGYSPVWSAGRLGRLESPPAVRLDDDSRIHTVQPAIYGALYYSAEKPLPVVPAVSASPDNYMGRNVKDQSLYGIIVEGRSTSSQPPLPMNSATPQSHRGGSTTLMRSPWLDMIDQASLGAGGTVTLAVANDDEEDEDSPEYKSTVGTSTAGKSQVSLPAPPYRNMPAFGGGELRRRREAASRGTSPMFDEDIGPLSPEKLQHYKPQGHAPAPYFSPLAPAPSSRQFSPPPPMAENWRTEETPQRRQITFGDNLPPVASPAYETRGPSPNYEPQPRYQFTSNFGEGSNSASPEQAGQYFSHSPDNSMTVGNKIGPRGYFGNKPIGSYYVDPSLELGDDFNRL